MNSNTTPTTQNEAWGFWGTMGVHACVAWPIAMTQIADVTGEPLESVRIFLDSKQGRHFADAVQDGLASHLTMEAAVARPSPNGWTGRSAASPQGKPVSPGACPT